MTTSDELKAKWRDASARLDKVERELAEAWAAFSSGQGAPPSAELLARVAAVREETNARLQAILGEMKDAAGERTPPPAGGHPG